MALMTIAEYAAHRARDAKAIRYAIEAGRITQQTDGLIDSDRADIEWEASTDEAQANRRGAGKTPAKVSGYAKARARAQVYEARLKKLRYEERAKNLVPVKDVQDAAFQAFRSLRDACMNLPSRIAALVAAESDQERCYKMLESEIVRIFDDFAEARTT